MLTLLAALFLTDGALIEGQIAHSPELHLEVVCSPESVTRGLSGRQRLGSDGMLFLFQTAEHRQFWMKQMHFNLDIIWLLDGEAVDISHNVPAPKAGEKLLLYAPARPVNMVLEIEAGKATEWQIKVSSYLHLHS